MFLYRLSHDRGFAIQILDTKEGGRRAELVTDGEVRRIRSGKHPVVAGPAGAPGAYTGISLYDGSACAFAVDADERRLLIDYLVGGTAKDLTAENDERD